MDNMTEWFIENYSRETVRDIINHGIDGGVHGLTYYSETCALYERFQSEIWDWLWADAKEAGQTVMQFIAGFVYCKRNDIGSDDQFRNILVWYAVERICHNTDIREFKLEEEESEVEE